MSLAQWVEREITVDGQPEPVRLGVWLSGTKSRRERLSTDQLTAYQARHGLGEDRDDPPDNL